MNSEQPQPSDGASAAERGLRFLPLDRFNAFSDGVFAIAITLLALDIVVPPEGAALWPALRELSPDLLGYYISFAFIGGIWVTHAAMTKCMKSADSIAYALNLVLLFFVGLLPFSTALMVTHLRGDDAGAATLLYGVNLVIASFVLTMFILYVAREPALLLDAFDKGTLRRVAHRRWAALGMAAVALVFALPAPRVAAGLYVVVSTWLLVAPLLGLRRHRRKRRAG